LQGGLYAHHYNPSVAVKKMIEKDLWRRSSLPAFTLIAVGMKPTLRSLPAGLPMLFRQAGHHFGGGGGTVILAIC
jgi:hypothetical protein